MSRERLSETICSWEFVAALGFSVGAIAVVWAASWIICKLAGWL